MIVKLLLLILFTAELVDSACHSKTFIATTVKRGVKYHYYTGINDCTVNIIPSFLYQNRYYLEIKWELFDVAGTMPKCKDYIEVFLSRQESSIGKYCSDYTGSSTLFNMYSSDGYAKIRFKAASGAIRKGFQFSYQLKSNSYNYMGKGGSHVCYYARDTLHHGILYSSGWPRGYNKGDGYCYLTFKVPEGKEIRITIMDLDLRKSVIGCNKYSHYFQIRGSSSRFTTYRSVLDHTAPLTERYCGERLPSFFSTSEKYVYAITNKPTGFYPYLPNRGFMIGFIVYGPGTEPEVTVPPKNKPSRSYATSYGRSGLYGVSFGLGLLSLVV